ncbi:hypothetical protein QP028_00635 [Corynebacterium suedekumii]|nr:hypothetical protein QP028_00635 [Corynebacterium suedekumii]
MLVVAAPDDADLTLKAGDTRKPAWVPRLRLQQYRDEQGFAPELQGLMESQADRLLKDLAKNPAGKDRRHTFGSHGRTGGCRQHHAAGQPAVPPGGGDLPLDVRLVPLRMGA